MAQPEIIKDIDARVKKSGDTMTGNLIGKYFQGTWLQTTSITDLGSSPSKIAVIKDDGWIYYRTPSELANDIGLTNNYVLKTGDTMTGNLTAPQFNGYLNGIAYQSYMPYGFTRYNTTGGWGLQTGTCIIDWGESDGGDIDIRKNCPNSGQISIKVDGRFYQDEGRHMCLDTNNFSGYALPLSGGTLTGQLKFTNSNGIVVRHIDGESTTFGGDLYLNYGVSAPIHFGSGGNYWITGDGLYYTGNCRCLSGYSNNTPALRWHALEFVSNSMTIGTNNGQCQPGSGNTSGVWYYPPEGTYSTSTAANLQVIRLTWQPNVWVNELFFSPNTNKFYHRSIQNGTALNWRQIWEAGDSVTGAVWNDYAEYRESDFIEPGYCLIENGNDTLSKSTERMQSWAGISSDTWGFAQGQTEKAQTPIAVAGRVLVYPYRNRNEYKSGDCVCTAPDGKVDIMTEEEIYRHPDKIIGVVSCVPDYEEWGGGENADRPSVKVDGRIWVRVK